MGLLAYRRKRHFNQTPEPAGKRPPVKGHLFVVQKHDASHLHYDFRLELDGVLKSWAVPKGPSLDPAIKRLAIHVEDHPVDYGSFEGTIPQGAVWRRHGDALDRGDWEPVGDPHEGYRKGRLKFILHGEKLQGGWMLIRTGGMGHSGKDQRQWLLFKERDEKAMPTEEGDLLEQAPLSVLTGRNLEEIAAGLNGAGRRNGKVHGVPDERGQNSKSERRPRHPQGGTTGVSGRGTNTLPRRIDVELATLAKEPPEGEEWLHEIKFDGYRMICRIDEGHVQFITRNHKNWTDRLAAAVEAAKELPVKQAILDGEVVALRATAPPIFKNCKMPFAIAVPNHFITTSSIYFISMEKI